MRKYITIIILGIGLLAGCTQVPPAPPEEPTTTTTSSTSTTTTTTFEVVCQSLDCTEGSK